MDREQRRNRFNFEDDYLIDHDIRAKPERDCRALVNDRHHHFAFERDRGSMQFQAQTFRINGFKKAGPDVPMNLDGEPDDA
jgi:hypothetical protein